jgi:hypothetical protein
VFQLFESSSDDIFNVLGEPIDNLGPMFGRVTQKLA